MREKIPSVLPKLPKTTNRIGYVYDFLLNTSYLADFWGEVRSARDASFHELQSSIENRKSVVLTLVSSIINSYFLMRQYDAQSLIAAETLQSRQEAYDLAVIRYDLGYTSILQVEQAIAEVESAKIAFEKIQISIGLIEDLISVLIGKPTTEIQRGLNLVSLEMPEDVLTEIPSSILDQRPDLMAQEQLLMAANAQIGVAKSLFFPRFNLAGFLGVEKGRLSSLFQNNSSVWNYSLSILQEIFTGGRLTSNLKLTEAEKRKALHQYQSAILNAFKEVNDALISHKYNLEIVETQKIQVEALKKYLVISNLKYNEGQIDYLTFLDAERQLFQAELEQAAAIAQSFISFVNIYKAMGGNWVQKADLIATDSYKY
jgi:multidrug efflux system outer membrane protein